MNLPVFVLPAVSFERCFKQYRGLSINEAGGGEVGAAAFLLRRNLERPRGAGVEGLHGSEVKCPSRSEGCEQSEHGSHETTN